MQFLFEIKEFSPTPELGVRCRQHIANALFPGCVADFQNIAARRWITLIEAVVHGDGIENIAEVAQVGQQSYRAIKTQPATRIRPR